jgi:hypothetical protein
VLADTLAGPQVKNEEPVGGRRYQERGAGSSRLVDDPRGDGFPGKDRPSPAGEDIEGAVRGDDGDPAARDDGRMERSTLEPAGPDLPAVAGP